MTRVQIPLHLTRSKLTIESLKATFGLGSVKVQREIADTYEYTYLLDRPEVQTTNEYFKYKRPLPYDTPAPGVPSYLMAMERTFPESSKMFFHPFFNLVTGPLPSTERVTAEGMLYPESWIEELLEEGKAKERQSEAMATLGDAVEAEKLLVEARRRASLVSEYRTANDKIQGKRKRRERWQPTNGLDWIHIIMLHLGEHARKILFTREGLATTWGRRYDPILDELTAAKVLPPLDSLTVSLALIFEASLIGDGRRFAESHRSLSVQVEQIQSTPSLKKVAEDLVRVIQFHLRRSYARRYDLLSTATMQYPQSWKPVVYDCWTEAFFGAGLRDSEED